MTLLLVIANAAAFILQNLIASAAPQIILNSGLSVACFRLQRCSFSCSRRVGSLRAYRHRTSQREE